MFGLSDPGPKPLLRNDLWVSADDAELIDAWTREWQEAKEPFAALVEDGSILGARPSFRVRDRAMVVWASPRASDVVRSRAADVPEWKVTVVETAESAASMRALLVAFGDLLAGRSTSLPGAPAVDDLHRQRAAEVLGEFRANGVEVVGVHLSFGDGVLEIVVPPEGDKTGQAVVDRLNGSAAKGLFAIRVGGKEKVAQATSETRPDGFPWNWVRGGKTIYYNGAFGCTSGPTLQRQNARFVLTAGHCIGFPTPQYQVGPAIVQYVTGTRCDLCAWGIDAALLQSPSSVTSHVHVHQAPGWWDGSQQHQGQTYLAAVAGSQPASLSPMTDWVCFEGSSSSRYFGHFPNVEGLDGRTECGISMSNTGDGFMVVHRYGDSIVCHGDSGGLVRLGQPNGQSIALGVLARFGWGVAVPGTDENCNHREPGSSWPGWNAYSEIHRILPFLEGQVGNGLQVQTTT